MSEAPEQIPVPRGAQEPGALAMVTTGGITTVTVVAWIACVVSVIVTGASWHGLALAAAVAGTAGTVTLIARVHHHRATSRGQAGIRAELCEARTELAEGRGELTEARAELAAARTELAETRQLAAQIRDQAAADRDAILKAIESERQTILVTLESAAAARDEIYRQHVTAVRDELVARHRTFPEQAFENGFGRAVGMMTTDITPILGELCDRLGHADLGARVRRLPQR